MKLNVRFRENNAVLGGTMSEMQPITVLDSPHFTGTPTAPTPVEGNYSEQIATTEFVVDAINAMHTEYGNIVTLNISEVTL